MGTQNIKSHCAALQEYGASHTIAGLRITIAGLRPRVQQLAHIRVCGIFCYKNQASQILLKTAEMRVFLRGLAFQNSDPRARLIKPSHLGEAAAPVI